MDFLPMLALLLTLLIVSVFCTAAQIATAGRLLLDGCRMIYSQRAENSRR